jgi:hypothetical protein
MTNTEPSKKFPGPAEFFLRRSLYDAVRFDDEQVWDVLKIFFFSGTYDNYCVECKRTSTFQAVKVERPKEYVRDYAKEAALEKQGKKPELPNVPFGITTVSTKCARSDHHLQFFIFLVQKHFESDDDWTIYSTVEKIGQHPSFSDINIQKLKNYSAVLGKEKTRELSRAIGLASHDVGIGSYVYLRRVFESLVEDAHQTAKKSSGWKEEEYLSKRMAEKIQMLKNELPPFLVEHPKIYSILSKGIHELSESDCLKNFETLKLGTELILDQRLEAKERENKIKATREALGKI